MNLIAPQNLAFAALMGAILLLYILRLKRREKIVASTLLWQESLRDLQANAPWQKLRSSLLMWLQLLVVSLATIALARPAIKVLAGGGQTIAIVLDASASMGATDVAPSRFESARKEASRLIGELGGDDAGAVIVAGTRTQVLAPLSRDKNVLRRALNGAQLQDSRGDLREAIVLAASILRGKKPAQIVVLSDGASAPIELPALGDVGVQWVKVGSRNDNVAITAMDAARPYVRGASPQVFVTLSNFSSQTKNVELELLRDGKLVGVRPVTIPAAQGGNAGTRSELFEPRFDSGLFQARFDLKDDLSSDNFAFAALEAAQTVQVLLLSSGNVFLEKALSLDGSVKLTRGTVSEYAGGKTGDFDVVVCDNIAPPPSFQRANLLVFGGLPDGAQNAALPVERNGNGVVNRPEIVNWNRRHPVTQNASWNDLRIAQSVPVRLKNWGQPLVESAGSPLIVVGTRRVPNSANALGNIEQRVVWCGFDLRDSDLPLRVAFPIFITNAVRFLAGNSAATNAPTRRAGTPISLPVPSGIERFTLQTPENSRQIDVTRRPYTLDNATRAGEYVASGEANGTTWRYAFGVSVLDKNESDLSPRATLKSGAGQTVTAQNSARANRELWAWFVLAALAVLSLEWWIFHRGV